MSSKSLNELLVETFKSHILIVITDGKRQRILFWQSSKQDIRIDMVFTAFY